MKRPLFRIPLAALLLTLAAQSSALAQSSNERYVADRTPLGQTVPYVRLQGGTPHSFSVVPIAN
ncbi:MAG: hypothetical protein NUW01_15335 [Gemmatimonadaceae bacterium]|nr:hypothetical protein [Gemmatimonadaceae bacterium]